MSTRPLYEPSRTPDETRLAEIEQALKRDPDREYRRQLVREYLDLTEPEPMELDV